MLKDTVVQLSKIPTKKITLDVNGKILYKCYSAKLLISKQKVSVLCTVNNCDIILQ